MANPGKNKVRRSRANSLNSPVSIAKSFSSESDQGPDGDSDSDKSLSTNENTLPTSGGSSTINSAEQGVSPRHSSMPSLRSGKNRTYEVSKTEIVEINGVVGSPSGQCPSNI